MSSVPTTVGKPAPRTERAGLDVDAVNIALMCLSGVLAFAAPVQLFLFAYAVLGPLHYLTEIGWLHQRAYFLHHRWHALAPVALGFAALALAERWTASSSLLGWIGEHAVALALAIVAGLLLARRNALAIPLAALTVLLVSRLSNSSEYRFWVLYMVPTLLHVCAFTLLFLLHGALRSRRRMGLLSVLVFLTVAASMWLIRLPGFVHPGSYAAQSYTSFAGVNQVVLAKIGSTGGTSSGFLGTIVGSPSGLALMRFIAFAYTYHYLNWFSKTKVIQWHRIPRVQLVAVGVLWLISLGIYASSYTLGLRVLFFLSLIHVLLEFPLNIGTAASLVGEGIRPLSSLLRRSSHLQIDDPA